MLRHKILLCSFVFYLFSAAPAAWADNECGLDDPTVNGPLADSYDCTDPSYADGVTYTADGDLTIDFSNDATSTIGGTGITLTGDGSENITFDSNDPTTTIRSLSGMDGDLLGVTTVDGSILITTSVMDGDTTNAENVDRAIFAESTGTGSIDITTTGLVDAQSSSNPADSIGIEALTNSGSIDITTSGTVVGNESGIRAVAGGSGSLTITASGTVNAVNDENNHAIDATTGTGLLTIDIGGSSGTVGGIRTEAGGDVVINVASGRNVSRSEGATTLDLSADGTITVNNAGVITGTFKSTVLRASDGALVINNDGTINDMFDLSGLTGGYTFNHNDGATWSIRQPQLTGGLTGEVIDNSVLVSVLGEGIWNNAGTVEFGIRGEAILAPGTAFTGIGDSLFDMRAEMGGIGQSDCEATKVAGCVDLSGGSTAGQTAILLTSQPPPLDPEGGLTQEANPGILLVDVSGGTSAADHFVLHPDSENYLDTSFYGPVITTGGPLVYTLLYNPNTQQHILSTVPTEEGAEYATFIDETLSIWHTTADAVAGRQADLRGGATGGGWVRLVSERTTRDAGLAMTTHGNDFTFDVGYEQDTRVALFGFDALNRDNFVIGLHGGLISSKTDYDGTGNGNEARGAAAGVYGGWWRDLGIGQLTVDATVNGNFLTLDHDASFEVTHSDIRSLGVRAEAGWKVPVIDGFYVQPLATVAYVRSNIETMELRQNDISFEDAESQRVALGVRLGGDFEAQSGITARYWLTGRAWDERAEDGRVEYATTGDPLTIADDISGSFEEVGFGASLSNREDTLSVFASGGTKFIDDVTNYNVTVGLRKRW